MSRVVWRAGMGLVALAALVAQVSVAGAQEELPTAAPSPSTLEELLEAARQAREERRYGDALEALLQAYNQAPAPALLFNIGKLYQDQGDCGNSLDYLLRSNAAAQAEAGDAEAVEALRVAIQREVAVFTCPEGPELAVTHLESHRSELGGAVVLRLGALYQDLGRCDEARTAWLDAAKVSDVGDAISQEAIEALKRFACTSSQEGVVSEVAAPEAASAVMLETVAPVDEGGTLRWTGYGLMGFGAAALLTAVIVQIDTHGIRQEAIAAGSQGDVLSRARLEGDADAGQGLATSLFVGGGTLALTGALLWWLGQPSEVILGGVELWPSPGGASVRVGW